jgi:hypothetical protein
MRHDVEFVDKIGVMFSALDKSNSFLTEVEDLGVGLTRETIATGTCPGPELVRLAYEHQPHFKMNMMFAMAISKSMYGNEMVVLSAFELISIRSICIGLAINGECSVNSALVNALQIPVNEVPVAVMQATRALDEYIKAVKLIELKIAELNEPDAYPALGIYRDYIKLNAQSIITEVNGQGFYGTYPEYVFVEMIILRKLSPHQYPSLYGTPSMPRWEVPYDQLQQIVLNAWRVRYNDKA